MHSRSCCYIGPRYGVCRFHARSEACQSSKLPSLRLKGVAADDPTVLRCLSAVRAELQTGSQFYNGIEDPTLIYILGIWPSLEAHKEFLASPAREEILGPQEDMLQFCWMLHMELDSMSLLPLDAPVLAIERMRVREDCIGTFDQAVTRHTQQHRGSHPFEVAHGWRCDTSPENHGAIVFTGWQTAQAHVTFATEKSYSDSGIAGIGQQYETLQVTRAWNLERKET